MSWAAVIYCLRSMELTTLEDGCIRCCYQEDGFEACCVVSSMHLTAEKEKQLKESVRRQALRAMNVA